MAPRTDSTGTWERRIDRGAVLSSVRRPDGTLLVEGVAAREGIYPYRRADGSIRRELVTAEMLQRTAKGLGRATVTLHHPDPERHPRGVTPENVRELLVGDTDGNVRVEDGGFVRVWLAVRHRDAIDAVDAGTQELSPGYAVQLGPGGNHPVYGHYDAEQIDRDYNHLAIVDSARGGHDVRLQLDAAYCTEPMRFDATTTTRISGSTSATTNTGGPLVRPLIAQLVALMGLGAQRLDSDDDALKAILAEQQRRNDSTSTEVGQLKAQIATLTGERDREKGRADSAEAEVARLKSADQQRADAAERESLERVAKVLRIDARQHADLKSLRRAIASAELGREVKADEKDDYVRGLVDRAKARVDADERDNRDDGVGAGRRAGGDAWRQAMDHDDEPLDNRADDYDDEAPRQDRGQRRTRRSQHRSDSDAYFDQANSAFEAARRGGE